MLVVGGYYSKATRGQKLRALQIQKTGSSDHMLFPRFMLAVASQRSAYP